VARVMAAMGDPNPVVDGRGFEVLRDAGIEVRVGVLEEEAAHLNAAFLKHVRTGLPFVTLKMGASLDGKVAARDGSSRWITGEAARADVQRLRAWADAVVVGAGTALADDPALTLRDPAISSARPPARVIVDTSGRVAAAGRAFDSAAPTVVATTDLTGPERRRAWAEAGAEVMLIDRDAAGAVSLEGLIEALGKRDAQGVLFEGGPTLAWSAIREDVVDQLVLYVAPRLVGGSAAPGWLGGAGSASIDRAARVEIVSIEPIGDDVKVVADVHRDR
jgi:diaminohydroxyphosphoribosylaminopyrimidine deaminase/5-amino-6-(5-phosphoribosylamino)uracil reductase